MATVMNQNELVRRAVEHICEGLKDKRAPLQALLDEAAARFNLSPKDMLVLERHFKDNQES